MAETAKKVATKKAAKKPVKKVEAIDELFAAVEAAREAGWTVHIRAARVNEQGVSEERG